MIFSKFDYYVVVLCFYLTFDLNVTGSAVESFFVWRIGSLFVKFDFVVMIFEKIVKAKRVVDKKVVVFYLKDIVIGLLLE